MIALCLFAPGCPHLRVLFTNLLCSFSHFPVKMRFTAWTTHCQSPLASLSEYFVQIKLISLTCRRGFVRRRHLSNCQGVLLLRCPSRLLTWRTLFVRTRMAARALECSFLSAVCVNCPCDIYRCSSSLVRLCAHGCRLWPSLRMVIRRLHNNQPLGFYGSLEREFWNLTWQSTDLLWCGGSDGVLDSPR